MKTSDIQSSVLFQIDNFFFLQEFDHYCLTGDQSANAVHDRYILEQHPGLAREAVLPRLRLSTGLALLTPIFAYAIRKKERDWLHIGFSCQSDYSIECRDNSDTAVSFSTETTIRVIRNALAHYADFLSGKVEPTVFFDPPVVTFYAKDYGKVFFQDEAGYVHFLSDFLRSVRNIIGEEL